MPLIIFLDASFVRHIIITGYTEMEALFDETKDHSSTGSPFPNCSGNEEAQQVGTLLSIISSLRRTGEILGAGLG